MCDNASEPLSAYDLKYILQVTMSIQNYEPSSIKMLNIQLGWSLVSWQM
jgi:hypothetical protein